MGKYSGILLCSDFDGTFYTGKEIPKDNITAIRHFRQNGGLFTIASGRYIGFLNPFFEGIELGVPLIHLNGALIYDKDNDKIIKESFMSGMSKQLVKCLASEVPGAVRIAFFPKGDITRIPVEEIKDMPEELARDTYKVVVHLTPNIEPEKSNEAVAVIKEIVGENFIVARSSWGYAEILDPMLTKSNATHFLKNFVGADTLVCVGDFENDLDMVRDADIGYAVANAADCLKAVADRITVSVQDAAIARIIEEL